MPIKEFQFNLLYFFMAFVVGMLYVYLDSPKPRIIIKYPTPYNIDKLIYKGLSEECYKFKVKEVECSQEAISQPII